MKFFRDILEVPMYDKFLKLLEARGVTPYRVHKETGISSATLSDWKNGQYKLCCSRVISIFKI